MAFPADAKTMPHNLIPDFTDTERWVVQSTLKERYGKDIALQFAEAETPAADSGELAWCPTVFWHANGASFAVIKIGPKSYRPIFYYHPETQLGTGTDAYDEIGDAVIGVLQVEADHMRKQKQKFKFDEPAAADGKSAPDNPDLSPLFWGD